MSTDRQSSLLPTLRISGALLTVLLLGLSSACSDDENTPVATGGTAGSDEPVAGRGGAGAVGGTESAAAGAGDEPVAGSGGMTAEAGTGGATSSSDAGSAGSGAVGGTAGGGSAGGAPIGTICEQVSAYLTSCGQTQGAAEATQNCNPDNELSQCVVACMLAKSCTDVGNWPAPILGCVSDCGA